MGASTSIPSSTLEKFTTFGDLLRFLRRRSGITQMELSIAVGYSDAQISRLEQNLRMPDIPTIEAQFISALDLEDDPRAVARLLELAANVRREDSPGLGLCPYKGLNYFDEADAELFAGREALTAKLMERTIAIAAGAEARFLAIVGASGSGKSSLVRAGLVPGLHWNPASANWTVHILTPTAFPLESLAESLTHGSGSVADAAALSDDFKLEPRSLDLISKRIAKTEGAAHCLLVVDQFEELFALCRSEDERRAFIENLLHAANTRHGPVVVLITLRADFYAHCAGYPQLRAALAQQQEYIGAMSKEELRRAIEEPARRGRWEFEPGLVDLLLRDVGSEPGALPLLSHALLETWQRRRGRTLTLSGYTSSGGVQGAIAETAEAVFTDQFTQEQKILARGIFVRLTELGDETAAGDTRRRATFSELILRPEDTAATRNVIKALADARLIITSEDAVEVAHEALIREWPTLRGWLEENREGLRLHRHLTEAALEWQAASGEPDLLYRGARLAQAREWAASYQAEMNIQESDFLAASIAASERETAEREAQRQRELEAAQKLADAEKQRAEEQVLNARQLRMRAIYLAGAFIIALAMAVVALFFGAQARQAAVAAQTERRIGFARELSAEAINNLEVDPERGILLAMQAVSATYATDQTWTAEAEDALRQALTASRLLLTLRGHTYGVFTVAFSPDGKRLATAGADGMVKIWDLASVNEAGQTTAQVVVSISTQNTHYIHGMAFSPDGKRLFTPGSMGTAVVWDAATGQQQTVLSGHQGWVSAAIYSPDGTRLATAGLDRKVKIWDAATGKELLSLEGHTVMVFGIAFSPDGARLASASYDGTAIVWDAVSGKKLLTFTGHNAPIQGIAFSPDGRRVATVAQDKMAKIWDADTGQVFLTLSGHTDSVMSVAYSPDGKRLATASFDGKVKVWDAASGLELFTLSGHTQPVVGVSFSPDCVSTPGAPAELCGTRLATASFDGTVKIWNTSFSQEYLTMFVPQASSGAFSPDGTLHAVGFPDGTVKLFDISSAPLAGMAVNRELLSLAAHNGAVTVIEFSRDGQHLATAGFDYLSKVWDISAARQGGGGAGTDPQILSGYTSFVHAVAFSPDGAYLATLGEDRTLRTWDIATGQPLLVVPITSWANSVTFSPDGTRLAAGKDDGVAIVWDAKTGKELLSLSGHTGQIWQIQFSPDGKRLATASDDGTGILWDAETGGKLFELLGHIGAVNSIAFSPDGKLLATGGQDGTVKVWDAATGQELHTFLGHTDSVAGAVFSLDGTRLITGSYNGMVRVYLLRIEDLMELAGSRLTRGLTMEECQQYLHLSQEQCSQQNLASPQESAAVALPNTTSELSPAAKGKICEVPDLSGVYDAFYNQLAYEGMQNVSATLAWENTFLEPHSMADYPVYINSFLHSGCDLMVIPIGSSFGEVLMAAAKANPNQRFFSTEWAPATPQENVWDQYFATDQAAFLAGYVAASVTRTGKVATYGGVNFPAVTDFMDGFALGVAYYNQKNGTRVELLGWDVGKREGQFTGNFGSISDGHQMGETLLNQGADIILPVAGWDGFGTANAVKEHGNAYVIGVDTDWAASLTELADVILTSVQKRVDSSVLSAAEAIEAGTFNGGPHLGTLENGGVSLASFYSLDALVSPRVKADLEQIKADITAGKIQTKP